METGWTNDLGEAERVLVSVSDDAPDAACEGLLAGLKMSWSAGGTGRLAIAAILAIQLLVPLIALSNAPAKFGFQMYSGIGGALVSAEDGHGTPIEIDQEELFAGDLRPDLSWIDQLPEALCELIPAAARVTVWQASEERTVSCKR